MLKNRQNVTNEEVAGVLDEIATLLEFEEANTFRVRAFRNGAGQIRKLSRPVEKLISEEGVGSLEKISGIGKGITAVIAEYLQTGRSGLLDRLRGEVSSEELFSRIGGIGRELAERIVDQLDIHTLEELEEAAYNGSLETVKGFGPQRIKAVRDSLAGILSRSAQRRVRDLSSTGQDKRQDERNEQPPVGLLLEVDAEYRQKAEAGRLRKVAPKRFNPQGEAWLPVMNTVKDGWSLRVLFSNTALAHELNATHDWVVIYYEKGGIERQSTVLTARTGPLKGKRVVRGREDESRQYYSAVLSKG